MNKTLTIFGAIALSLLIFSSASSANAAFWSGKDLIAPDSSFGFLQTWKESIQTFFTFGAENKAKQYLHLADVRLDEYKKMIEQGKTDIAEKVLEKYQNKWRYILVDEYQDTNNAQFELTRMLAKKYGNICVVGDFSQSIYSWRGADYRNLLKFKTEFPNF